MSAAIEKKLRIRLCVTLFIYTVTGYLLSILLDYSMSSITHNPFSWLRLRIDLLFILYLVIGFFFIFLHYWKKPWRYLQEVMTATQTIYQPNDSTVSLSEPLKAIEKQMNQVKMAVLLSQQAVTEAEHKKNELVMYLAHDIRTPLTSIIGYLSLLDEAADMPVEQKAKYVGIALEKAVRLEKLINEFFEITRYHTHQIQLTKASVDLHYMLVQLIDEFYPALSAKGSQVVLHADEDLNIYGDAEKLARALNNLLKNAVAYCYPDTDVVVHAHKHENRIRITFENEGHTIPSEKLATIFEKFSRLDDARQSDKGGAGLGLSIAREIIGLHGGELSARSENDRIYFTISLPAPY